MENHARIYEGRLTSQNDPIRERLSIPDKNIGVLNAESARKKE